MISTASLESLPKDKLADLTDQVTPYDVVLYGKDISNRAALTRVGDARRHSSNEGGRIRRRSLSILFNASRIYAEELAASNNWVISGKRTADGKPILANDPHLQPSAPGIWYLSHLSTPSMRVSGVTFPGVPGIVLGHNEFIAWGATNVGPDVQDLYVESFDSSGKYKTPEGMAAPHIRKEEIKVRISSLKPDTVTVSLDVVETKNGVIFAEDGGRKYR